MKPIRFFLSTCVFAIVGAGCETVDRPATYSETAGSAGAPLATAGMTNSGGSTPSTTGGSSSGAATAGAETSGGPGVSGSPSGGAATGGQASGGAANGGAGPVFDQPKLVTSTEGAYWKAGEWTEAASGTADVTVNDTAVAQSWEGFGGAFNEKGWEYLLQLSQADRDAAMQLLFGVNGARFNYGRIPIGASDYATDRYTLNENAGDTSMSKFSIERDKQKLIPYIKAALAVKSDVHLWASPWTPPTWMKNNGKFDRGSMKEDETTFAAFALYLTKFVQEYAKEGLKIEAIHPQNEPGFEQDYPSCLWTGPGMATFIGKHLGPMFEAQNVTAQIFMGTMSSNSADPAKLSAVTGDATAMKYVKGFGLQWGMLSLASGLKSRNLPIWQTEHKCGNYPWKPADSPNFNSSKAPNDFAYGVESWGLLRDWIKAGVTSYAAWNMVLDPVGAGIDMVRFWPQNALLVVDGTSKKLQPTPAYYVFRHFSQFVAPGAKVVGTTGGDALAFKNPDGSVIAVMYNSGAAKKSIVSIGGKLLQFDMPAKGWATVNAP
jgi:glucosylceramidase